MVSQSSATLKPRKIAANSSDGATARTAASSADRCGGGGACDPPTPDLPARTFSAIRSVELKPTQKVGTRLVPDTQRRAGKGGEKAGTRLDAERGNQPIKGRSAIDRDAIHTSDDLVIGALQQVGRQHLGR